MNSKQHGHKLSLEVDVTPYLNLGIEVKKIGPQDVQSIIPPMDMFINYALDADISKMHKHTFFIITSQIITRMIKKSLGCIIGTVRSHRLHFFFKYVVKWLGEMKK